MAAYQAPLSLGFSRQEFWSQLPFPSPVHACMLSHFSHAQLCATPWIAAHQAPLSTGFSRQEYWSGLPFPSPGTQCSVYEKSEEAYVTVTAWWRESQEIRWGSGPIGLSGHGEDFDLSHRRFPTRGTPRLLSETQITQWFLRSSWFTPGKPQATCNWICLSWNPLHSRRIPPTAPSEHPCQLKIPSGETEPRTLLVWLRSHWVLQRQRGMI